MLNPLFATVNMNAPGKMLAARVRILFSEFLTDLELHLGNIPSRELSIVRTKLEEASFFAIKALALNPLNQEENVEIEK